MRAQILACLAFAVACTQVRAIDKTAEAFIVQYIEEHQDEVYETILNRFIAENRRDMSRRQLETCLNKIDQLEPYYITLKIYKKLCHIFRSGQDISNLDDEQMQLIQDIAIGFHEIQADLQKNWVQHSQIATEHCQRQLELEKSSLIDNNLARTTPKTVVAVSDGEVVFNTESPPVEGNSIIPEITEWEPPTTSKSATEGGSADEITTTTNVVGGDFVTDENDTVIVIDDDETIVIQDNTGDYVTESLPSTGDNVSDEMIIIETGSGGSGSGSGGSGSGSGSGGSGSGFESPSIDSSGSITITIFTIIATLILY